MRPVEIKSPQIKIDHPEKNPEKFERGKMGYRAVIVVLVGVLVLSQDGIGGIAQSTELRTGYACWGGCYNECILQTGKNPSERLPCYFQCLGSCIAHPASDNQYYCQLGCSLEQCVSRFSSDGRKQERCLDNCSTKICSINT